MTLSLDTAYRSFGGEVEASSTPTICRLPDSRRHQLWAIAQDVHMSGKVFFQFDQLTLAKMRSEWSKVTSSPDRLQVRQFLSDYENGPLAYKASAWLRSLS